MQRALTLVVTFVALAGCHGKQEVTAPPPPLRPEPEPKPVVQVPKDCTPLDPTEVPIPISFDQRSIPEGARLAEQASHKLKDSSNAEADRLTREQLLTEAVNDFITALSADPYNIKATYGLAAAYARIDRKQCSINMLTRLIQMRPHESKKAEVDKMLDRLLGRRKQPLDPDFSEMRRDNRFRDLIAKMCADTNDPNCVYGGQKSGH